MDGLGREIRGFRDFDGRGGLLDRFLESSEDLVGVRSGSSLEDEEGGVLDARDGGVGDASSDSLLEW